jgi:hypothetical protein
MFNMRDVQRESLNVYAHSTGGSLRDVLDELLRLRVMESSNSGNHFHSPTGFPWSGYSKGEQEKWSENKTNLSSIENRNNTGFWRRFFARVLIRKLDNRIASTH